MVLADKEPYLGTITGSVSAQFTHSNPWSVAFKPFLHTLQPLYHQPFVTSISLILAWHVKRTS